MRPGGMIYLVAQRKLRDYIREHGLAAGARLPSEANLAAELGVSRISLREATRSLQTLGVIEAQHGNGLFVSEFSFKPIIEQLPYGLAGPGTAVAEVLTAREAMEAGLMPAVARAGLDEELRRCAALAREMIECDERGEDYQELDEEFHRTLYSGLRNPLVDNLIDLFWRLFGELCREAGDRLAAPAPHRGVVHARIIEALMAQDEELASRRMHEHFDDLRRRVAALGDS
ncbi:DNA-binding transcriptional regulator, FadR family [Glycomyces harbinensis]|uniref:DNA-binding transcriptional regulator, FadR family n=2 Tax=Glycomyces harbinensis TaxID=58114 RepID=A0A1G7DDV6_9ACTN|nr:FCD domain-containing protein [Glycomyces harbinensis]SDE48995.1 DNA-binding transcriptional regulator, FadR family [Glycomyces harbinensis]